MIFKATALVGSAPSVVFLHPEKALPGSSAQPVCFHGEGRLSGTPSPAGRSGPGGGSSRKPPGLPEVKEAAPVVDSGLLNGDSQLKKRHFEFWKTRLKPNLSGNRSKGQRKKNPCSQSHSLLPARVPMATVQHLVLKATKQPRVELK